MGLDPRDLYPGYNGPIDPKFFQAYNVVKGMEALMEHGAVSMFETLDIERKNVNAQYKSGQIGLLNASSSRLMIKSVEVVLAVGHAPWLYRDAAKHYDTYNPGEIIIRRGFYEGVIVNNYRNFHTLFTKGDFASVFDSIDSTVDVIGIVRGGEAVFQVEVV